MSDIRSQVVQPNVEMMTSIGLQIAEGPDGQKKVIMQIFNVHGMFIVGIDPENAEKIGNDLIKLGQQGKTRLVTAPANALEGLRS